MVSTLCLAFAALNSVPSAPSLPNIVLVLADDVGYGDLSCYGATKVKTPNLDRIARQGIRFTDAHSPATVCTPTRYALLTGDYAFRNPAGAGILSGVAPLSIPLDKSTLPKMLQSAGYKTGIVGKWHLGLGKGTTNYKVPITEGPNEVGFDYSFIVPATGDRVPCVYVENGKVVGYDPKDPIEVSYRGKIGDEPTGKENPELLKVKLVVGHADTIVNGISRIGFMTGGKAARWVDEDMADTFAKQSVRFIERHRKSPFFLYLPTHDVHAPLMPNPRFNGKSDCGLRGDTLTELDWTVGEVLKTLDKYKLTDNTIFIFTSDNGGTESDGYADPRENLNGHKVNGALRGFKYQLYEGGHRVPFVLSWPAKAPKGKVSDALVCQIDLMATFAKLTGQTLAQDSAADSFDLSSAFLQGSARGRADLILHLGGAKSPLAYREGSKVIVPKGQAWELYDLSNDLSQKTDLAMGQPDTVKRMSETLERLRTGTKTRP